MDNNETTLFKEAVKKFEGKRKNPVREIGIASVNRSPYQIRTVDLKLPVTKEEEQIWDFIVEDEDPIYRLYGRKAKRAKAGFPEEDVPPHM